MLRMMKDYFTVLFGHGLSALLGFLASIVLARALDKDGFGIYSAFVATLAVVAAVMDLGISQSIVRFASSKSVQSNRSAIARLVSGAIRGKLALAILVGIASLGILHVSQFGKDLGSEFIVFLVPIGALSLSFFFFVQGVLQTRLAFPTISIMLATRSALFLGTLIAVVLATEINYSIACLAFVVTTALGTVLFSTETRNLASFARKKELSTRDVTMKLLGFGKWLALSATTFSIFQQLPIAYALTTYGASSAADLAVSITLLGILGIINVPLLTVLMPQLSAIDSPRALKEYLNTMHRLILPTSVVIVVLLYALSGDAIALVYGEMYANATPIFMVMLAPFLLTFITMPLNASIIYVLSKPEVPGVVNTIQLALFGLVLLFLADSGDIMDMVIAYSVLRVGGTAIVTIVAYIGVRNWAGKHVDEARR